jgi:hypothetical protein
MIGPLEVWERKVEPGGRKGDSESQRLQKIFWFRYSGSGILVPVFRFRWHALKQVTISWLFFSKITINRVIFKSFSTYCMPSHYGVGHLLYYMVQ